MKDSAAGEAMHKGLCPILAFICAHHIPRDDYAWGFCETEMKGASIATSAPRIRGSDQPAGVHPVAKMRGAS